MSDRVSEYLYMGACRTRTIAGEPAFRLLLASPTPCSPVFSVCAAAASAAPRCCSIQSKQVNYFPLLCPPALPNVARPPARPRACSLRSFPGVHCLQLELQEQRVLLSALLSNSVDSNSGRRASMQTVATTAKRQSQQQIWSYPMIIW